MSRIQKPAETTVPVKEAFRRNYDKLLSEAIEFQFKADSVTGI